MVIIGKSIDEINTSLELLIFLFDICNFWSMKVNAQKAKVMVLRKEVVYSKMKCLHIMATGWK